MSNLNNYVFEGFIGRDPEVKYLDSGLAIASFSVALTAKWTNKAGEEKERTDWIPVTAIGNVAKSIEAKVQKGTKISGEGRLVSDTWNDRDGKAHSRIYVNLKQFEVKFGGRE